VSCCCNQNQNASGSTVLQPQLAYYNTSGQLVTPGAQPVLGLASSWWWLLAVLGGVYVAHRQRWL
jgi:hypothetical protein